MNPEPVNAYDIAASFLLFSFTIGLAAAEPAGPAAVVLVRGTVSTPNVTERNYAARITKRLSDWFRDMGVSHAVLNDEAVATGALRQAQNSRGARVAVLCYNPDLPLKEMAEIKAFVAGGGKLLVFYSSDRSLAALMHVKLGEYIAASHGHQWYSYSFNKAAPPYLPKRIFQNSRNIRPVYPDGASVKIIAYWEDASGKTLAEPAWIQSDCGFWMSHVLLDSDIENKKAMLLALTGLYAPAVWRAAADRCRATAAQLGRFKNLAAASRSISEQARGTLRESQVKALLARAAGYSADLDVLYRKGMYPDVVATARAMQTALVHAYGYAQEPVAGELCGVWDHSGTGLYPGDWDRTCKILSDHGITAVFPNMLWAGHAHYDSRILPHSDIYSLYGDQVAQCVRAARKNGVQVHVWKICWRLDRAASGFISRMKKEGRLQVLDSGDTINWLCPSNPRNQQLELDSIKEVVTNYQIDGIHLDYNRYVDGRACYCAGCKEQFEKQIGKKIQDWPAAVRTGKLKTKYRQWRCSQTERLVREASRMVRAIKPGIRISAAVFGSYPQCVPSVGQDWAEWLRKGYVHFVCPMNYVSDTSRFSTFIRDQLALPVAKGRVFPGIGVTADESRLTAANTIEQIRALRREGAAGYVLFELNTVLHREILPVLRFGLTAE